jgi:hypothetical protein
LYIVQVKVLKKPQIHLDQLMELHDWDNKQAATTTPAAPPAKKPRKEQPAPSAPAKKKPRKEHTVSDTKKPRMKEAPTIKKTGKGQRS